MARHRRTTIAVLVTLGLLAMPACDGDGPAADPTAQAATTPRSRVSLATPDGEDPIRSSVSVGGGPTIASQVEVRIAEILSDYSARESEAGTTLTVPARVLFDFDEASLRPDAREVLDEIVEVLVFYETAPVVIEGHTDARGSDAYNLDLSRRRAEAVAGYLTDAGIDADRLSVEGRGEAEPVASNDTDAGRQANRRVEVLVRGVSPPDVD